MLHFERFEKRFGNELIIAAGQLTLAAGMYWIKGENGAGKTTLLKSIAGLLPFDGTISVDGVDIKKQRMTYRSIVTYAEAEPLYPDFLTGNDLIDFYIKTKGGTRTQADELVAAFGMGSYISKRIGAYSSGMAKKLSLALAFIGTPKLVLLDEPLITLDVDAVAVLVQVVGQYAEKGVSFLITSHQPVSLPNAVPTQLIIHNKQLAIA